MSCPRAIIHLLHVKSCLCVIPVVLFCLLHAFISRNTWHGHRNVKTVKIVLEPQDITIFLQIVMHRGSQPHLSSSSTIVLFANVYEKQKPCSGPILRNKLKREFKKLSMRSIFLRAFFYVKRLSAAHISSQRRMHVVVLL